MDSNKPQGGRGGGWQAVVGRKGRPQPQQQQHQQSQQSAQPQAPAEELPEVQVPVEAAELGEEEHRLSSTWTFHYYTPAQATGKLGKDNWQSQVQALKTVASAEQFWGVWQTLPPPSQLKVGSDYHLFKENITPSWEDPQNKDGGIWVLELKHQDRQGIDFDESWLHTALALVGSAFDNDTAITGVTCGIRVSRLRLRLWTKHADDEKLQLRIGQQMREFASIPGGVRTYYEAHADSMKSMSKSKPKYSLEE